MPPRKKVREAIFHNLGLKSGSVLLSLLLWAFVIGQEVYEVKYRVPVIIHGVPEHLAVVDQSVAALTISVLGQPRVVRLLSPQDFDVNLHLDSSATPGETIFEIPPDRVRVPNGVRVIGVSPSRLNVKLEEIVERQIPVHPRVVGRPAVGYRLGPVTATPNTVTVRGAASVLTTVDTINTESIDIANAESGFQQRLPLLLHVSNITSIDPSVVNVEIGIEEETAERIFTGVAVACMGPIKAGNVVNAACEPSRVDVRVTGLYSAVQQLRADAVHVVADASKATAEIGSRIQIAPVVSGLPADLVGVVPAPATITVSLMPPD
ncbi:MAG: YbbR-like domain-containing protein [Candidatus Schekmanbacteria bacterium]|nr:YbbR-like domain-containing protein [Candidatus Schekmanbacteria bacterium]